MRISLGPTFVTVSCPGQLHNVPFNSEGISARARVRASFLLLTHALGPSCTCMRASSWLEMLFLTTESHDVLLL